MPCTWIILLLLKLPSFVTTLLFAFFAIELLSIQCASKTQLVRLTEWLKLQLSGHSSISIMFQRKCGVYYSLLFEILSVADIDLIVDERVNFSQDEHTDKVSAPILRHLATVPLYCRPLAWYGSDDWSVHNLHEKLIPETQGHQKFCVLPIVNNGVQNAWQKFFRISPA